MTINIKNGIKEHKILIGIIGSIVFIPLVFYVNKMRDPAYRLFKPVINAVDHDVLNYDGCYIGYDGIYECDFMATSYNTEEIGDELKLIYDKLNRLLESKPYKNYCINVDVLVPRYEHGAYNVIVNFKNFKGNIIENAKIYNHICYVCSSGINSEAEMYDSNYDYEINHKEYWEYFSDAEELHCPQE